MSRSHTRRAKLRRKRGMQQRRTRQARALPGGSPTRERGWGSDDYQLAKSVRITSSS